MKKNSPGLDAEPGIRIAGATLLRPLERKFHEQQVSVGELPEYQSLIAKNWKK